MKNKKVMLSLAVILVVGILITKSTYHFVERSGQRTEEFSEGLDLSLMAAEAGGGQEARQNFSQGVSVQMDGDSGIGSEVWEKEEEAAFLSEESQGKVLGDQEEEKTEAASISPLDTTPVEDKSAGAADNVAALEESVSYYKKRLQDLDGQIQKNRDSQNSSNLNNSAKSAASNELKLWDGELSMIYNAILDGLNEEKSQELVEDQRAWMKERDSIAMEAAKKSAGGSRESVEYTVSQTESTRQRAYQLVEIYAEELAD